MADGLHVIFGAGPAGSWTARALRDLGEQVRVVCRSGRPNDIVPVDVPVVAADAADRSEALAAADGAAVIYQAVGAPYQQWAGVFPPIQRALLDTAAVTGAQYVSVENLYMYGPMAGQIHADSPESPRADKGRLRATLGQQVLEAHRRGSVQAALVRSADYYGPGVLTSAFGAQLFDPLVRGKKANLLGRGDLPHAMAYIEDVGRAVATIGTHEEAFGRVWLAPHAPAITQRQLVQKAAGVLGVPPRARTVGPLLARLVGLGNAQLRASVEMLYQFTSPFLVDATPIEHELGLSATPIEVGVRETVAWFSQRLSATPGPR